MQCQNHTKLIIYEHHRMAPKLNLLINDNY